MFLLQGEKWKDGDVMIISLYMYDLLLVVNNINAINRMNQSSPIGLR